MLLLVGSVVPNGRRGGALLPGLDEGDVENDGAIGVGVAFNGVDFHTGPAPDAPARDPVDALDAIWNQMDADDDPTGVAAGGGLVLCFAETVPILPDLPTGLACSADRAAARHDDSQAASVDDRSCRATRGQQPDDPADDCGCPVIMGNDSGCRLVSADPGQRPDTYDGAPSLTDAGRHSAAVHFPGGDVDPQRDLLNRHPPQSARFRGTGVPSFRVRCRRHHLLGAPQIVPSGRV